MRDTMLNTIKKWELNDDSSEEDIDSIPAEMRPYMTNRIDKKRKLLSDWRKDGLNAFSAFFRGRMRRDDYIMIWSLIILFTLTVAYTVIAARVTENSLGIMFGITALHIILLILSMISNIFANRRSTGKERLLTIFAFVLIYVSALAYLFAEYDTSLLGKADSILSAEDQMEKQKAIDFTTGGLILVPFFTAFATFAAKAYRDNSNGRRMTPGFWLLLVLNLFHCIALVVIMFLYLSIELAITSTVILGFLFYAFF